MPWVESLRRISAKIIAMHMRVRTRDQGEPAAAKEGDEEKRRLIIQVTISNTKLRAIMKPYYTPYGVGNSVLAPESKGAEVRVLLIILVLHY